MMRESLNCEQAGQAGVPDRARAVMPDRHGSPNVKRDPVPSCGPRVVQFQIKVRDGKVKVGRSVKQR